MEDKKTITISITQKSMFPKTLPIEVILGSSLAYGSYQGQHLVSNTTDDKSFIAYLPNAIGRGIKVVWNKDEIDTILLRLNLPTCQDEIQELIQMSFRILKEWTCSIYYKNRYLTRGELKELEYDFYELNRECLSDCCSSVIKDNKILCFECAMHKLYFGKNEVAFISADDRVEKFSSWLKEIQSKPAFIPDLVYDDENILFYLPTSVPCILPYEAAFFDTKNHSSASVQVVIYDSEEKVVIRTLTYDALLKLLPTDRISYYDAENFWLRAVYKEEYMLLLRKLED